jgi:hypothetical protein
VRAIPAAELPMTEVTIECVGTDGLRLDRQREGASDTLYLSKGEKASLGDSFLAEITAAEEGEPHLRLLNAAPDTTVEIYTVLDGTTVHGRTLAPAQQRPVWLAKGERLLLIPILTKTA